MSGARECAVVGQSNPLGWNPSRLLKPLALIYGLQVEPGAAIKWKGVLIPHQGECGLVPSDTGRRELQPLLANPPARPSPAGTVARETAELLLHRMLLQASAPGTEPFDLLAATEACRWLYRHVPVAAKLRDAILETLEAPAVERALLHLSLGELAWEISLLVGPLEVREAMVLRRPLAILADQMDELSGAANGWEDGKKSPLPFYLGAALGGLAAVAAALVSGDGREGERCPV